ncbi:DUF2793 domain-containing protein [Oceanicola sp. 22II-s10i]|uniref:DUF2793 domain-containing protein n=1 Tax=Oceanicola sp. 22II-s10i TaxID=1317116 RepID=UPI00159594C1|nr:DUF2793 domain-containing protein [Oceanicola sp. 22II-s10i]
MSDSTARLSLPLIQPSQAQKHVTHNEALARLDTIVQLAVTGFDAAEPPGAPAQGEIHALGAAPTGAWAGQGGMLAVFRGAAWSFVAPHPGWLAAPAGGGGLRVWTGSVFAPVPNAEQADLLGLNATADSATRLAVAAAGSLFSHDGGDHRLTVNKAAPGDTASVVFQTGWSGRAEFGLAGGDDFSVKVSADGSAWTEGLRIDAATGAMRPGAGLRFPATPAPVAEANTLDCYAEGSWSPGFGASGTAPSGASYSASGSYVKIGRFVLATFEITITAKGTGGAGNARIESFPFSGSPCYSADIRHSGITFPGSGAPMGRLSGINMTLFATNGADMLWDDLPTGSCSLLGSISYIASS